MVFSVDKICYPYFCRQVEEHAAIVIKFRIQLKIIQCPFFLDMNSVMLRLPDGTLQSVEDYIVGIIKDASSQIEKERQNTSITADDIFDKSADVENVQQTPLKTELNNSTHGKDSTRNDFLN